MENIEHEDQEQKPSTGPIFNYLLSKHRVVKETENSTGKRSLGWSTAHEEHVGTAVQADQRIPLSSMSREKFKRF